MDHIQGQRVTRTGPAGTRHGAAGERVQGDAETMQPALG